MAEHQSKPRVASNSEQHAGAKGTDSTGVAVAGASMSKANMRSISHLQAHRSYVHLK